MGQTNYSSAPTTTYASLLAHNGGYACLAGDATSRLGRPPPYASRLSQPEMHCGTNTLGAGVVGAIVVALGEMQPSTGALEGDMQSPDGRLGTFKSLAITLIKPSVPGAPPRGLGRYVQPARRPGSGCAGAGSGVGRDTGAGEVYAGMGVGAVSAGSMGVVKEGSGEVDAGMSKS